ncbi:MAG: cytochrome c oxidase subunit 3 [Myxococcus sp.]|nr:cytochrome c oxidase subunit 3 [Myxococcus sp.]
MEARPRALEDPPGGVLLWLIVALELLTFAIVFVLVALLRRESPAPFAEGQQALSLSFGLALTALLITSGAVAAQGIHRFREGRLDDARRWLLGAGALGGAFVVVKVADFLQHLAAGHRLGASDFWDAYLLSTGFHLLHVVVGLGLLLGVAARVGRRAFDDAETAVAGSVLFWHLCDVAWFFLFPLFFASA